MRKLATIQRISAIQPIVGADAIELAFVLGWQVVVRKGDFAAGDLAVYFEIDSWLDESIPAIGSSEGFRLRFINWTDPEGKPRHGMRLKTIKLRKQLSQGLILKASDFASLREFAEGDDVSELIGVEKWEAYEEVKGNAGGINKVAGASQFPSFIRKTDQERVQNCINELEKHIDGESFEVTIKLDGSSMTVFRVNSSSPFYADIVDDIEKRALKRMGWFARTWWKLQRKLGFNNPPEQFFGVCSRNIQLNPDGDTHFAQYAQNHDLERLLDMGLMTHENYAFQGELIAPSIQHNYEKVSGFEYYVYDVFDIDKQTYLLPFNARVVCRSVGLKYVPVLAQEASLLDYGPAGESFDPKTTVDGILNFAEGPGMNPGVKREGVVFKSNSTPFSFKAISNSYLLAKKD